MQILIKLFKRVADKEARPSVLILFINENRCSTLAFETGRTNISSMSNKTKCHSLLRLELNIWCHIFLSSDFQGSTYFTIYGTKSCHCSNKSTILPFSPEDLRGFSENPNKQIRASSQNYVFFAFNPPFCIDD